MTEMEMDFEKNKLFVKGLEWKLRGRDLVDYFAQWGKVVHATVKLDQDRKSLGYGFVEFETEEDAERALNESNEQEFSWRKIYVSYAKKRQPRDDENN